jgi:endonuclease YncB( thermonuclease family)
MKKPFSLKPKQGKFYTYQIVKPRDLHQIEEENQTPDIPYAIDLGFTTRIDLKIRGIKNPREGQIIESVRTKRSQKTGTDYYRFRKSSSGRDALYTYKATVERVIDGDTLWLQVDLGFRVWTRQKLRLRGINTEELGAGGEKAGRYVKRRLSLASFVVIKVSGRDKFGRYLTDLFYLENEPDPEEALQKGIFLNQELLDRGLAVPQN